MIKSLRRHIMMQGGGGGTPRAIQCGDTTYFRITDMLYYDRFEFAFRYYDTSASVYYGYQDNTHYNWIGYEYLGQGIKTRWQWGGGNAESRSGIERNADVVVKNYVTGWYQCGFYVNGGLVYSPAAIGTPLTGFSFQYVRLACFVGEAHYFNIYIGNSDTLRHQFVPAVYNGEAGFMDLVDDTFHGNQSGTGAFVALY